MIVMTGHTLKSLMCVAYKVRDGQVTGGPKWIDSEPASISTPRPIRPRNDPKLLLMLQTLLADRFQLAFPSRGKDTADLGYCAR